MNTLVGIGIVFHTFLFLSSSISFFVMSKKKGYHFKNWLVYSMTAILVTLLSLILVTTFTKNIPELATSKMALMGYTGFPIIPSILALLSYPILVFVKKQAPLKLVYADVFLGIFLGAPLSFAAAILITMLGGI